MVSTTTRYEFGDFALDVGQQRLSRRDTGEAIPLTGKVFDTLVYLVERAEQTLDRDVLLAAIWPGVIVEENSLSQNISTLRQALGEVRGENRYILTIPRKGYRFIAKALQHAIPDARITRGEIVSDPATSATQDVTTELRLSGTLRGTGEPLDVVVNIDLRLTDAGTIEVAAATMNETDLARIREARLRP